MAYRELIELQEQEIIAINIIYAGKSVYYILKPAGQAFKEAAEFLEREKKNKIHHIDFEFHIMINQ